MPPTVVVGTGFAEHMHCNECMKQQRWETDGVAMCRCSCTLCALALEYSQAAARCDRAVRVWAKAVRDGAR